MRLCGHQRFRLPGGYGVTPRGSSLITRWLGPAFGYANQGGALGVTGVGPRPPHGPFGYVVCDMPPSCDRPIHLWCIFIDFLSISCHPPPVFKLRGYGELRSGGCNTFLGRYFFFPPETSVNKFLIFRNISFIPRAFNVWRPWQAMKSQTPSRCTSAARTGVKHGSGAVSGHGARCSTPCAG